MIRFGWILIVCAIAAAGYLYTNSNLRALSSWLGAAHDNFRPGMVVEAVIVLAKQQEALWMPRSAVMSAQGKNYVYMLAGGRALRQEIALGVVRNGYVEVTQGVDDGDAVIIDQPNLLKPGIRLRPLAALEQSTAR